MYPHPVLNNVYVCTMLPGIIGRGRLAALQDLGSQAPTEPQAEWLECQESDVAT